MADKEEQLYFIAIVPPSPVYDEARQLKEYFRDHYNSKAALRSPPHITLHMPFRYPQKKEKKLTGKLEQFAAQYAPFPLDLCNFSAFPPRTIFIDVMPAPSLMHLQKELARFCQRELKLMNANYRQEAFHPHLTVAFRDLKKPQFHLAWEEFKDRKFEGDFTAEHITLLKHNGKYWEVFHNFILQNKDSPRAVEGVNGGYPAQK